MSQTGVLFEKCEITEKFLISAFTVSNHFLGFPNKLLSLLAFKLTKSPTPLEICFYKELNVSNFSCLPLTLLSFMTEFSIIHVMFSTCDKLVLLPTKSFKFSHYSKQSYFTSTKCFSYFKWDPWEGEGELQKSCLFSFSFPFDYKSVLVLNGSVLSLEIPVHIVEV